MFDGHDQIGQPAALQVRPPVIPLLQRLLKEGTFQASALDFSPDNAASSSSSSAPNPSSAETQPVAEFQQGQHQSHAAGAGPVEPCLTRLIFTAEKIVPWLEQLVTQIKVLVPHAAVVFGETHT